MDARIAVITGTVFAGVLVGGALAAPRIDDDDLRNDPATLAMTNTSALAEGSEVGYYDQGDDDYDEGDEGDERYEGEGDDDHEDHDDHDDDEDDD